MTARCGQRAGRGYGRIVARRHVGDSAWALPRELMGGIIVARGEGIANGLDRLFSRAGYGATLAIGGFIQNTCQNRPQVNNTCKNNSL
jgi:hypothetical protein